MIDESTFDGRVVAAAMRLAAARPWHRVSLLEIARAAGVGLDELRQRLPDRAAVLEAFSRMIDADVLAKKSSGVAATDADETPRDRLFDVLMSRFDSLQPYRAALRSILDDARQGRARLPMRQSLASQRAMLEAAGITVEGPGGAARVAGLAGVYARVVPIWLDDDDPGLAHTMAALDRRLREGERCLTAIEDVAVIARRIACGLLPRGRRDKAEPLRPADAGGGSEASMI